MSGCTAPGNGASSARSAAEAGTPCRGEVGIVEEAFGSGQQPVVEVGVDPFEIEDEPKRLPHADVGEEVVPQVEDEPRHALRAADRQRFAHDAAVADRREIVGRRPACGTRLLAVIEQAGAERLEHAVGVAVIFDVDLVEVEESLLARQILGPIIGVASQNEPFARLDIRDPIRTGPDGNGKARLVERRDIDSMTREHRHQGQGQRHLAVAETGEIVAESSAGPGS